MKACKTCKNWQKPTNHTKTHGLCEGDHFAVNIKDAGVNDIILLNPHPPTHIMTPESFYCPFWKED